MKDFTLTLNQASALELLADGQPHSANDFNRSTLNNLVDKDLARKHELGYGVSYSITGRGRDIYKSIR